MTLARAHNRDTVPLSVRRLYEFDLNEAIDVYDYFSHIQ